MSEQIEYIDPKEIKRDSYQPRLNFKGIDELAKNIEDEKQYDPVHVDANNYLIDGERRWLATLKLGKPLKVIRHLEVTTVEQRDAIRDSLGEHRDPIGIVERAWNYARRVAYINTDKDYTPLELQELKINDYEHLKQVLDAQTGGPNGTKPGGFSELSRRLTQRSGKEFKTVTVREQTRIIFLSPDFLEKIDKTKEQGGIPYSYGREASRLYKYPEIMKKVEQEIFDGTLNNKESISKRVTEYQKELERQAEEEATKIRETQEQMTEPEQVEEPFQEKFDLPPPEIPDEIISEKAKEIASKTPKPKKTDEDKAKSSLLKRFGKGNSIEAKIEKAKELGIDVSVYSERFNDAVELIKKDPVVAWEMGKQLKKDIESSIKEAKKSKEIKEAEEKARKKVEEEAQKRIEEEKKKAQTEIQEIRVTAKEEAKEELKKDREFIREVTKEIIKPPLYEKSDTEQVIWEPPRTIENPLQYFSIGLSIELYNRLNHFKSNRSLMFNSALIFLIEKGLEVEGYGK